MPLQYVRKVSGTKPSQANQAAFDEAVDAIAHATQHLLDHLTTSAPPKDREVERAKARARNEIRFSTPPDLPRSPDSVQAQPRLLWAPEPPQLGPLRCRESLA